MIYALRLESVDMSRALFIQEELQLRNGLRIDMHRDEWETFDRPSTIFVMVSIRPPHEWTNSGYENSQEIRKG